MADTKISELPEAATLTGVEAVPIVQGGETVRTTAQAVADLGAGTNGADGKTWHNADGTSPSVPSAGIGVDGDYAFDSISADVFYKAEGNWTQVANLKGADGTDGGSDPSFVDPGEVEDYAADGTPGAVKGSEGIFLANSNSDTFTGLLLPVSGDFTLTACIEMAFTNIGVPASLGLMMADSNAPDFGNHRAFFGWAVGSGVPLITTQWFQGSALQATWGDSGGYAGSTARHLWLQLGVNGANQFGGWSLDGVHFYNQINRAKDFTPNCAGFGIAKITAPNKAQMLVKSLQLT
jgi:hypothetical protein